jgi:HPt (histidine-containing phosphotransfer) domain-containing protein
VAVILRPTMRPAWGQNQGRGCLRAGGGWREAGDSVRGNFFLTVATERHAQTPVPAAGFTRFFAAAAMIVLNDQNQSLGSVMTAALSLLAEFSSEQTKSVIDEDHLRRMTLGDASLEREVLEIFARQTVLTCNRLAGAEPARAAAIAHTIKGSARGIGAWHVATAAERLEQAASGGGSGDAISAATRQLEAASAEVRDAIASRLAAGPAGTTADPFDERSQDR